MTNREMFLLATSILFASTTAGLALQGILHHKHGPRFDRPGHERPFDGPRPHFFKDADTDKDGFITKDEMTAKQTARLNELFATVETDHDGKLSAAELEKGRELMRAKMKARFEAERKAAEEAPAPAAAQ